MSCLSSSDNLFLLSCFTFITSLGNKYYQYLSEQIFKIIYSKKVKIDVQYLYNKVFLREPIQFYFQHFFKLPGRLRVLQLIFTLKVLYILYFLSKALVYCPPPLRPPSNILAGEGGSFVDGRGRVVLFLQYIYFSERFRDLLY